METQKPDQADVIVVGAGLGGLSAAAHLSALGLDVLLLERYKVVGGCSHVFRRRGKWEFDAGVHYIGECGPDGVVRDLFRGLGLDRHVEWLPLDPDGFDTIVAPGLEFTIPTGWAAWQQRLLETFPAERKAILRYTTVMRAVGENLDRMDAVATFGGAAHALRQAGIAGATAYMPHAALMLACGLSTRATLALSVQDSAIATTSLQMPVITAASLRQHFIGGGAWYPRGGGQTLDAAFLEVIRSHGGRVRTDADVTRILLEGGRTAGVQLADGEVVRSRLVVSDADVVRTYRDLVGVENLPLHTRTRMRHWTQSYPLINGIFGVEVDAATLPNSNVFAIPTWEDAHSPLALRRMLREMVDGRGFENNGVEWANQFARRQPMFVQSSTRRDLSNTRSAPRGHAAIEVQTIVPANPKLWGVDRLDIPSGEYRSSLQYQQMKEIVTEAMVERIEQAHPEASGRVIFSELGTPATQEFYTHSEAGTSFGLASTITQSGALREGPKTPIKGLFLAGASTPYGPGTAGAMVSGLMAAAAITGRPLLDDVRAGIVLADPARLSTWDNDFDPLLVSHGDSKQTTITDEVSS